MPRLQFRARSSLRSTPSLAGRRAACALALAALALPRRSWASERLRIAGSGSAVRGLDPVARAFAQRHGTLRMELHGLMGSRGGLDALLDGHTELAATNRPPQPAELAQAITQLGGALQVLHYALTPFVVAVHARTPVQALTLDELNALYREPGARYPDGSRARPVLRLLDGTTSSLLVRLGVAPEALKAAAERRGRLDAAGDIECARLIETVPGAFGPTTLALLAGDARALRALPLGGRVPSVAALQSGAWSVAMPLYLVAPPRPSPLAERFVEHVRSAAGRVLLAAHGHAIV